MGSCALGQCGVGCRGGEEAVLAHRGAEDGLPGRSPEGPGSPSVTLERQVEARRIRPNTELMPKLKPN